LKWINNWNLVDSSAPHILGDRLLRRDRAVLDTLAASTSLWEQRISILATPALIRAGDFADMHRLSISFLSHPQDLNFWKLREAGKRDMKPLRAFLEQTTAQMPRAMLRDAIEKLPEGTRQAYLAMKS
jgi:3-methyladenine DNA glycosylase AlkD